MDNVVKTNCAKMNENEATVPRDARYARRQYLAEALPKWRKEHNDVISASNPLRYTI